MIIIFIIARKQSEAPRKTAEVEEYENEQPESLRLDEKEEEEDEADRRRSVLNFRIAYVKSISAEPLSV